MNDNAQHLLDELEALTAPIADPAKRAEVRRILARLSGEGREWPDEAELNCLPQRRGAPAPSWIDQLAEHDRRRPVGDDLSRMLDYRTHLLDEVREIDARITRALLRQLAARLLGDGA